MHNTCFFPDCHLLAVTAGSISIPYLAGYSEIFKKPNFQVVKMEVHVHLKNAFQAELETEGSRLAIILGLPPRPPLNMCPDREILKNGDYSEICIIRNNKKTPSRQMWEKRKVREKEKKSKKNKLE